MKKRREKITNEMKELRKLKNMKARILKTGGRNANSSTNKKRKKKSVASSGKATEGIGDIVRETPEENSPDIESEEKTSGR